MYHRNYGNAKSIGRDTFAERIRRQADGFKRANTRIWGTMTRKQVEALCEFLILTIVESRPLESLRHSFQACARDIESNCRGICREILISAYPSCYHARA